MVGEHPSLAELHLRSFVFAADGAIALIDQLKSLQTFHFGMVDSLDYGNVESKLDNRTHILTKSCGSDSYCITPNCTSVNQSE